MATSRACTLQALSFLPLLTRRPRQKKVQPLWNETPGRHSAQRFVAAYRHREAPRHPCDPLEIRLPCHRALFAKIQTVRAARGHLEVLDGTLRAWMCFNTLSCPI